MDNELSRFVDSLAALVAFVTPTGEIEYFNRDFLNYTGRSLEELRNWVATDTVHPDDVPTILQAFQELDRGLPYDELIRIRGADGEYRRFRTRMAPCFDTEGAITRWCSVMADVEDQKRAEALLEGEVRMLEMVALGRPLLAVLNALCRLTEDLVPGCLCSILPIEASRAAFQAGGAHLPDGRSDVLDGRAVDPNLDPCSLSVVLRAPVVTADIQSDPRWASSPWPSLMAERGLRSCRSTPILSDAGDVAGVFAIYRPEPAGPSAAVAGLIERFTKIAGIAIQRARGDEALRASEADLRRSAASLVEGQHLAKLGSYVWRPEEDELVLSEEFRLIFGYEPGETATLPNIWERMLPEYRDRLSEQLESARNGHPTASEFRLRTPDGAIKHLRTVTRGARIQDGRLEMIGSVQDVTESMLAQEALNQARGELAHVARVATLNAMTASIAHEVSQPLSGIMTNASTGLRMLAAEPPDVAGAIETARRTVRDADRASGMLRRLRAMFSKTEPVTERVDLNNAAQDVIALSTSELQRRRAHLKTELTDDLPAVNADRVQLQQVILNLMLNAAEAMDGVEDRPRSLLVKTQLEGGGGVRLEVRDAGTGFDPGAAEKLFEAFYTTKANGMGIGLSICRSIIENHNGRLWATPNDGPGATFSFSIPAAAEPARSIG